MSITVGVKDPRTTEVLLLELRHRLQVGFLSKRPIDEVGYLLLDIPLAKADVSYLSLIGYVRNGQAFGYVGVPVPYQRGSHEDG